MIMSRATLPLLLSLALCAKAAYQPLITYSGTTFFDGFDFYGDIDNTTWGNVTYVDAAIANSESLAYVNGAGNAIIKVDNSSQVLDVGIQYRKSIRLTSKAQFDVGTLFVIDALHMPYGCSVWPSIWLNGVLEPGQVWPQAGEIDLIEAINLMDHNQMALHSYEGCVQPANVTQLGHTLIHNCNDTTASGCTVAETKAGSFGKAFADNKGGAFALQFDVAGVFMWFWPRANIPTSITQATPTSEMNLTDWGTPSAAYPASGCNVTEFFPAQQLVIDISLCGLWAGIPDIYSEDCPGTCFSTNIAGNGSNYGAAYFEIPAIRTYTVNPGAIASVSASGGGSPLTTGSASGSVSADGPGASQTDLDQGSAMRVGGRGSGWMGMGMIVVWALVGAVGGGLL
ncbi:GH16 domain-containing protein [Favolaschia claudopus]|uniref:GH16 domain-containing protein n=1 Tax=Favolaschia claudopus TaxID=2862362 RepID=A0AAW0DFC2_9AGAR